MNPRPRASGIAGVIAGAGLAVEGLLWSISGWTAETFDDPSIALRFLQADGSWLRAAVFVGAINLVFAIVFVPGLAERLRSKSPTLAAATLWFGIMGIALHLLVPLGHWYGVPAFIDGAERDVRATEAAWQSFTVLLDGAGGAANIFLGLSMAAAGWAGLTSKSLPASLSWVGLLAGALSVLTVLEPDTALSYLAEAAFGVSLVLTIVFRTWAGVVLARGTGTVTPAHELQSA